MKFKYETTIENSKEATWDLMIDLNRRSEWIHFIDECYVTHQTDNWVGTKFIEKLVFLRIPLNLEQEVTKFEKYAAFHYGCKTPPFYPKVYSSMVDNGDGTITVTLEFDIKMGAFMLVPKKIIKKQVDNIIQPLIDEFEKLLSAS